jgi:hypothetical protein
MRLQVRQKIDPDGRFPKKSSLLICIYEALNNAAMVWRMLMADETGFERTSCKVAAATTVDKAVPANMGVR